MEGGRREGREKGRKEKKGGRWRRRESREVARESEKECKWKGGKWGTGETKDMEKRERGTMEERRRNGVCTVCRTGDMNAGNKQMMINYVQR